MRRGLRTPTLTRCTTAALAAPPGASMCLGSGHRPLAQGTQRGCSDKENRALPLPRHSSPGPQVKGVQVGRPRSIRISSPAPGKEMPLALLHQGWGSRPQAGTWTGRTDQGVGSAELSGFLPAEPSPRKQTRAGPTNITLLCSGDLSGAHRFQLERPPVRAPLAPQRGAGPERALEPPDKAQQQGPGHASRSVTRGAAWEPAP